MIYLLRSIVPVTFAILAAAAPVAAAAEMSLREVVAAVLKHQPDIAISRTDTAIAAADADRVEGLLDANINGSISGSNEQLPLTSEFQSLETRKGEIAAGINLPLVNGGTLSVQASYSRRGQDFVQSPFAALLAKFNPEYRSQMDITYRHALLRGAGRPDYAYGLESVAQKTHAARLGERIVARTLALSALNAFFRLASDDINIAIAQQAVERAKQLLDYQKSRQRFGLIEEADALQTEALLASRHTDLQRAVAQRQSDESTLNRLMLYKPGNPVLPSLPTESTDTSLPDIDLAEQQALSERPDLKVIEARLKAADADLAAAQDIDSMQLDVVAQLGTRALRGNAATAAASGLSINDRIVSLSLEMQDSVGRNSAKAAIRKAALARQRLNWQRQQALERIRDDLAAANSAIRTGIPTLRMATRQAVAEQRKYQAELKRYREGRSDTATLVQFEGDLSNAESQKRLQQLTLQLARFQLAWAKGSLLKNLGIELQANELQQGTPQL